MLIINYSLRDLLIIYFLKTGKSGHFIAYMSTEDLRANVVWQHLRARVVCH